MRAVLRIVVRRAGGLPALPLNWDGRARHSVRAALLELRFGRLRPAVPTIYFWKAGRGPSAFIRLRRDKPCAPFCVLWSGGQGGLPALPLNWDGRARHSVRAALLELRFGRLRPAVPTIYFWKAGRGPSAFIRLRRDKPCAPFCVLWSGGQGDCPPYL